MPLIKFPADQFIKDVYSGKIGVNDLPIDLYNQTQAVLKKHLFDGFDANLNDLTPGSAEHTLLSKLSTNIELFSAAKTYQQVRALNHEAATNPSYTDYKVKANQTFDKYNGTWLQAEADTTLGQAQSAKKWLDFEKTKGQFQLLQYDAILDPNTSDICRHLDGIVLPVDHPFWNNHAPLNHFGCRCLLRKLSKYDDIPQSTTAEVEKAGRSIDPLMQPLFKMNPGKEGVIFQETGPGKHNYFNVPKSDVGLAKRNFDLPLSPTGKDQARMTAEQFQVFKKLDRIKQNSHPETVLQEHSLKQFVLEKKQLTKEYLKQNGNKINTDEARKLFTGYNGTNAQAVHEASSALSKEALNELLAKGKKNKVTLYAGGAGSGKTSAIEKLFPQIVNDSDAIIDGNLAKYEGAAKKINQFLDLGKEVEINYVYRDPVDAWENGVIKRMLHNKEEQGRVVQLSTFLENTEGSLKTMKAIYKNGLNDLEGVNIKLIDNSKGQGRAVLMGKDSLFKLDYPTDLRSKLERATERLLKSGTISREQYEALIL